ncbi:MAG: peptide ABC transporter substrate-binding protein, partial [Clostridia bacterium]|nr:peptide ABC transporter substrate-binding protein [Clostridia bacterium]
YPALNGYIPHGAPGETAEFRDEGDADGYTLVYDPDQAKELLAKAGYDESNPLKLHYKYSNNGFHGDVATLLHAFWTAVGIEVELDSVEYGVYYDQIDQGDFEICCYADSVLEDAIRLLKLWTTEGQVVAAVSDPVYDEMCDNTLQLRDHAAYIQAMHEMEDYLVEENVYLIPLFEYMTPILISDRIQGMTLCGIDPFFGYSTIAE